MLKRYQEQLNIIKKKLSTIGFYLEEEDNFSAIFGNNSSWKIDFYGERYGESYEIDIRNINNDDMQMPGMGFSVYFILQTFGLDVLYKNKPLEQIMDYFIEYEYQIFNETFPYREAYDELNKIPDWVKQVD